MEYLSIKNEGDKDTFMPKNQKTVYYRKTH